MGIKNPEERSFYEIEATGQNWSIRELKRQFDSGLFERLALSRDKEGVRKMARIGQVVTQPKDLLKDTPGRYVGAEEVEGDGVPFEKKMSELSATLYQQFDKADQLETTIRKN